MAITTVQRPAHARHARQKQGLRGNPWWILAAVSVGVIMVGLDASVVAIANPRIATDLNASLSDLQWITDAYLLSLASLLIFGGKLGDMFGRRRVFLIGVVGFAITSVGIGLIGSVAGVIAMRALQGVFGALLMPSTLAIIRKAFPQEKLNTAIGIWGAATGVSVAGGIQSTSVQLGAVLGTTILGSVLSSKVGSTLVDKLATAGTPATIAEKLAPAKELVSKGLAPSIPGAPPQLTAAIASGSHEAFMAGLQLSMWVGAAAVGAVLALFVRRGQS